MCEEGSEGRWKKKVGAKTDAPWQKHPASGVVVFWREEEEEEEERRPARSSSSLRIAGLREGSGVLALPFPFSDFCAGGLCGGGRIPMRSEVQAVVPPRGGIIVIVTVRGASL